MPGTARAELIVVTGGSTPAARAAIERLLVRLHADHPDTAVLHHGLLDVPQGIVWRRLRFGGTDRTTVLDLVRGCVSCTLREDLLPSLHGLGVHPAVRRIVLHLDPVLEPETVCAEILGAEVDGSPVTDAVDLRGVVTVLDTGAWLEQATGDGEIAEHGLAELPGDERTIAQLVVAQAEFADLIVHVGAAEGWMLARTGAVLARLNPVAARVGLTRLDARFWLDRLPLGARRGRPDSPHAPLLRGQPPLEETAGIRLLYFAARRPFHPDRLHRAIDVLLDGVVRTRGRVWLASRPEAVLWVESAGGGLQVGHAGDWLAAGDARSWQDAEPERHAQAALHWHPRWGDRAQELAILIHEADAAEIEAELDAALLTEAELAEGESAWRSYPDPFGWWHADPCDDTTREPATGRADRPSDRDRTEEQR